ALHDDFLGTDRGRSLIYRRFAALDKPAFRGAVLRGGTSELMLTMVPQLRLGDPASHLLKLFHDLVALDADRPELFWTRTSLLKYFDEADIDERGLAGLMLTLERQASVTSRALSGLVGDLRGLEYLAARAINNPNAVIVVIDCDAIGFLDWLQ